MKRELETRGTRETELRLSGDDKVPVLEGHIAVFDQLSEDFGGFREKIAPGAFAESLGRDDIRALWNHDDGHVLGRVSAGTLDLSEDATGLAFKNRPPAATSWFKDCKESIIRRDVTGCSFGFYDETPEEDMWSVDEAGTRIRTLRKVTLVEVSPGVTFPAYPQADVALRSRELFKLFKEQEAAKTLATGQAAADLVQMDLRNRRVRLQRLAL